MHSVKKRTLLGKADELATYRRFVGFNWVFVVFTLMTGLVMSVPVAYASEMKFSYDGNYIQDYASVGQTSAQAGETLQVHHNQKSYGGDSIWLEVAVQKRTIIGTWTTVCAASFRGTGNNYRLNCTVPSDGIYRLHFKSDAQTKLFHVWGTVWK